MNKDNYMKETIKSINLSIDKLNKLKKEYEVKTINEENYITEYRVLLREFAKNISNREKGYNKIKSYNKEDYPINFDFWFKKYYDNLISLNSLSNIYKLHKLSTQTMVSRYIKQKNLAKKQDHLINDLGYKNPYQLNISIDNKYLSQLKQVSQIITSNQDDLDKFIFNCQGIESKPELVIDFGSLYEPAIIDFSKFAFRPSLEMHLDFIFTEACECAIILDNNTFLFEKIYNSIDISDISAQVKNSAKSFTIKLLSNKSNIIICTSNFIKTFNSSNNDSDSILNNVIYHIDEKNEMITLEELEKEIEEFEGISIDIKLKNNDRPKDQIYVKHYPYKKPIPSGYDLEMLYDRLKRMGLEI